MAIRSQPLAGVGFRPIFAPLGRSSRAGVGRRSGLVAPIRRDRRHGGELPLSSIKKLKNNKKRCVAAGPWGRSGETRRLSTGHFRQRVLDSIDDGWPAWRHSRLVRDAKNLSAIKDGNCRANIAR